MAFQGPVLIVRGLSRRQQFNLLDHVTEDLVEFPEAEALVGEFGDPTTIVAIVSLTSITLAGIFAWLAKEGAKVEFDATVTVPGTEVKIDLKLGGVKTKGELYRELLEKGIKIPEFLKKQGKTTSNRKR